VTEPPAMTEHESAELKRMTEAFATWAQERGILSRFTEDQIPDLVRAFAAGCTYALNATGTAPDAGDGQRFTVTGEFTCIACGVPESQLPAGHEAMLTQDERGWPQMVCTSAVQRTEHTITMWGMGGD
jgi:hypothetical protein